jgi:O-antigen/teichoic acid export membrane protein
MAQQNARTEPLTRRLLSSPTVHDIARVLSGETVTKAFVFLATLLLIRGLTKTDYDAYVTFQSVRILFAGLVGGGINSAMVRYGAELRSHTGRRPLGLYRASLVLQVAVYGAVLLAGLLFANRLSTLLYGKVDYAPMVGMGLVAGAGYLLIQLFRGVYQAEQRFNVFIVAFWVDTLLILAYLGALAATHGMTLDRVMPGIAAIDILVGILLLVGSLGRSQRSDDLSFGRNMLAEMLRATVWLIAYYAALAALSQMDVMMLGHHSTQDERACYGVALRYYMLALMSLGVIHAVLLPKLSRLEMQDPKRQVEFIRRWVALSAVVAVPLLVFDLVGRPVFTWLNGQRYDAAFDVWVVLSIGIWLGLVASPLVNVLLSRRLFRTLCVLGLLGLAASYAGCRLLIPMWGGRGAAVATVLGNAVINVTAAWIVWRHRGSQPVIVQLDEA